MSYEAGRPRARVTGLVLCVVGALGLVLIAWNALAPEDYRPAPGGPAPGALARPGPAAQVLARLVEAMDVGDREAAEALAPAGVDTAVRLGDLVANARSLPLADVSARYVDQDGPVARDGSWTASVALTWRVAGVDRRPARAEVSVGFVLDPAGRGVLIGSLPVTDRRAPLWWTGRLSVARAGRAVVSVAGSAREADRWLGRVESGTEVVRRVLPRWDGAVVVEVAGTASQVDRALDVPDGTYAGVAAVTAPVGDDRAAGAPVHVLVNPEVIGRLRPRGAQVVTSHELAHVATDATRGSLPTWLLEGFADYVALRDVALPESVTAARADALVRSGGLPTRFPSDADLAPDAPDLDAAYELSWQVCVALADLAGEQGLLRVYTDVREGGRLGPALRAEGLTERGLLAAWRTRLGRLTR